MIRIREDKKDVLQDRDEELLKERIRRLGIRLRDVTYELKTHVESCIFNLAIIMLAGPHTRVYHKLKLSIIEFEECYMYVSRSSSNLSTLDIPGKQCMLMARKREKNSTRCSGNSEKSLLIISSVHSNTFSMIIGTWSSIKDYIKSAKRSGK